jgi:predicted DCC family thiol-disulfide oxidoreductase YuxK
MLEPDQPEAKPTLKTMQESLFYDGSCAMCSKEIYYLERWKDDGLALVDIHSDPRRQQAGQFSDNELLSILHLQSSDGRWLIGLDATVSAWQHTPLGWLFKPLRWPLIKPIADSAYFQWANKRACKLGYR